MSQNWHSNGSDSSENQQGDYPPASLCGVLEYPLVDPAILAQENNGVVARGPRLALACGPYDDDESRDE